MVVTIPRQSRIGANISGACIGGGIAEDAANVKEGAFLDRRGRMVDRPILLRADGYSLGRGNGFSSRSEINECRGCAAGATRVGFLAANRRKRPNCYCHPGIAGGLPLTLAACRTRGASDR